MSKTVNPFREDSAIHTAFNMATEGTTRAAIERYANKHGLNVHRIFHVLRVGKYGQVTWEYRQDTSGKVKLAHVSEVRVAKKGPQRATHNKSHATRKAA